MLADIGGSRRSSGTLRDVENGNSDDIRGRDLCSCDSSGLNSDKGPEMVLVIPLPQLAL